MSTMTSQIKPLYSFASDKPMNIVVFGSGSGTNLEALIKAKQSALELSKFPLFEIKALFTDRLCRFQEIGYQHKIPILYHSFADFFKRIGISDYQNTEARVQYDQEASLKLQEFAHKNQFSIDLIILAGYQRMLFTPMLQDFKNKIINIHPGDLTIVDSKGFPRYAGSNAVYQALLDGAKKTRSSVILIDENMDTGPILVSGPWVNYDGEYPITKESARFHQEKQKIQSDWPACICAVELIARGKLAIGNENKIFINGKTLPREGYELIQ